MGSLKGTRISLRGPEPDDLDSLYLWENDKPLSDDKEVNFML